MSVKFVKNYKCYFIGDVATFRDEEESDLIARGTAERVTLPLVAEDGEPDLPAPPSTTSARS